jgi:hypothetical protein
MWRIWWAPNNARKWQMEFHSAFKGLKSVSLHFLKRQIVMSESNITNFIFSASNDNKKKTFEVSYLVGHRVGKLRHSSA